MKVNSGLKALVFFLSLATTTAFAFQPIPKESAKALKVTRGKPFSTGLVFVNGKYIAPPYVVERWGTGIRINQVPVTGQVVDWGEFVKTQAGVKVEKKAEPSEPAQAEQPAPPEPEPAASVASEASALDDLFDDGPSTAPAKTVSAPKVRKAAKAPAAAKPAVTYSMSGDFVPNADSRALLKRINDARTEIDRILRAGGFIFFGNSYSRVTGDRRTLLTMLDSLPEIQQRSESADDFRARARSANLIYLNEVLCEELYRNRIDYRKLKERRERYRASRQWEHVLEDVSEPIF